MVTVEINSTTLNMEVDTGASHSLVSETTYNQLKTQTDLPPLQSTTAELRTYTGEQIPILGILNIPVCYHNQRVTVELLVVKGDAWTESDGQGLASKDNLRLAQFTSDSSQSQLCFGISAGKTPRCFCRWVRKSQEFHS